MVGAPASACVWAALRQAGGALLDFVYPPACLACRRPLEEAGDRLCAECWAQILGLPAARCQRCGCPLEEEADSCANCAGWEMAFERAVILGRFAGAMQLAVHALKFGRHPELGLELGRRMGRVLKSVLAAVDLLVPVPLHPARQRERGYNQSLALARGLSAELRVPVGERLVERRINTRQQARLNPGARQENLARAFTCASAVPRCGLVGVVDDVLTTGATLDACSLALRQAGVPRVWAVALASPFNPPGRPAR